MADNFKTINDLDISFKEFMPGQIIQSAQFNDDMRDIEEKVNEVIGEHNGVASTVVDHLNNKNNPHEVTAHQVGTYTTTEVDEFIEGIKHGHLYDRSITNKVLADWSVDNRTIKDRTITASKVDDVFGHQIDISENIEITGRYTKNEVDELVRSKVGEGTYTKEEIDEKFQNFQAGQIIDKTISADKVTSDFGDNIDISNNTSITNRYTKGEVDMLISMNGLPRDWGNITEQVDVDTGTGSLPVAGHMVTGQFVSPATSVLDIDVKENVEARGEYNSVGERLDGVDSQIKNIETRIDNIGESGGSSGEVDLSGYVTKELGNASQITFADGQTFQDKLNAGTLKGDKGDKGDAGQDGAIFTPNVDKEGNLSWTNDKGLVNPITVNIKGNRGRVGPQGEQGPAGADGQDGATFTPSVDAEGNLSWTNDKGLVNPPTVNIKGEKGDSGTGSSGANINDTTASATTTYSSNKIETIKESLNSQIEQKANQSDLEVQKQRIDSFTTLASGSTTGDAELIDGRIGADGVTYSNIGTAIRTQCGNLNNLLDIKYELTSNNRIDDSKFVGQNFDTLIGHNGNTSTFTLGAKLKSNKVKGFIEFEDGTSPDPNSGFFWSLKSSTGEVSSVALSTKGTLVTAYDFDKYDQISIGSWATYNKNIKTFFVGDFNDSYDNVKRDAKSKAMEDIYSKMYNITPEQCTFFTKVDNLLKNITLQKGYAINPSYGLPDAISGIPRTSTDYMELRDDCKSTYCNTAGYIYYYDANKNYLQSITPQSTETPAGIVALPQSDTKIKYIRYTFTTEDDATLSSYWITDQGKPYENDKLYIPKDKIEDMSKTESWYKGKKICAYGDSVTEQNKWQPYVSTYFNCSFYNRGVGGTTVTQVNSLNATHMSSDTRINTIPTDSDVILIFAGHNDWSYASINMGDLKTDALSESTSFKSAYALMLKKIQARCPNAKLITITPVGGRTEDAVTNQDKQFYVRDLCMTDFAIAVKEVSAYYGIPCIDVNANCGINTLNHTTYIADLIHPNEVGGKLIANEVINGMKRFEPINL